MRIDKNGFSTSFLTVILPIKGIPNYILRFVMKRTLNKLERLML